MFNPAMASTGVEAWTLINANHRLASTFYARASPNSSITHLPGALAVHSGLNATSFNLASLTTPSPGLAGTLHNLTNHYDRLGTGSALWVCEQLAPDLSMLTLEDHGYEYQQSVPGMLAEHFVPCRRSLPPHISIRTVETKSDALVFAHLVSIIFHVPFPTARSIYANPFAWRTPVYGFLAYREKEPVGCAMVAVADGVAGFYSVGIISSHRGHGYGEKLMRAAFDFSQRELSCEIAVLQSSPAGRKLYDKLGFREQTRFTIFNRHSVGRR